MALEQALRKGRAEFEGWRVRKDGSRFWANVVVSPILDEEGRLHGFGKVTRDLTERRRAEEQRERLIVELRDALCARDEFLQIASHELKTPLTPLQLQLEMLGRALERSGAQNQRLTDKLAIATRQTDRLTRLVERMLEVSRVTVGEIDLSVETLDLAAVLRDVVSRLSREAQQQGVDVVVHGPPHVPGRWDKHCLEEILTSLLSNGIKYGAGKGVEVDLDVRDETVRVNVTDHGIGMEEQALRRMFGRFERAVSTRHFGGFGLGLFLARRLAEAHGGTVLARSQPGLGSVFTLVLPVETPGGTAAAASARA
jgi:signal transduction histidine kinase